MVQILSKPSSGSIWLFICGHDERFMFDVRHFAEQLKSAQDNKDDNFYFFAPNPEALKNLLHDRAIDNRKVFDCIEFKNKIESLKNIPFLGCIISSHGNCGGIEVLGDMKPAKFLNLIHSVPGLTDGLLLLGQCYSGIFNMPKQSKVCVIGASNFCPSLSFPVQSGWSKNIFLYFFANWIKSPSDIDGDDQNTILDAYKYTSSMTNDELNKIRSGLLKTFNVLFRERDSISSELIKPENITNIELQARYGAITKNLDELINLYHITQESWISDINTAMRLIL